MRGKKGNITIISLLVIAGSILMLILGLGIGVAMATPFWGEKGEPTTLPGGSSTGGGCYLKDGEDGFTDKSLNSVDQILAQLDNDSRLTSQRDFLQEIIRESTNANISSNTAAVSRARRDRNYAPYIGDSSKLINLNGTEVNATDENLAEVLKTPVNPAVLISFFGAEQSYNQASSYKAFGCGNFTDGGADRGETEQITCALTTIRLAIQNIGPYNTPEGENTWNRLLYHYVEGNAESPEGTTSHLQSGYVSGSNMPRISIVRKLVPDQVECSGGGSDVPIIKLAEQELGTTAPNDCAKYNKGLQLRLFPGNGYCYPWCATFLTYIYNLAHPEVPIMARTDKVISWFKANQVWIGRPLMGFLTADQIQPGDAGIVWVGGANPSSGMHAVIVEKVVGEKVHTIEGNTGDDIVARRSHDLSTFIGVGRMKE